MPRTLILDRAKETTVTQGDTQPYELDGAVAGFRSCVTAAKEITGDSTGPWEVRYLVSDVAGGGADSEWGVATLTEGTPDTLDPTTVEGSSNGGARVNWGAGTRDVLGVLTAKALDELPAPTVRQVGASGEPPYATGWEADSPPLVFWKDAMGMVHVQGRVKTTADFPGGSSGTVFVLPSDFRPLVDIAVPLIEAQPLVFGFARDALNQPTILFGGQLRFNFLQVEVDEAEGAAGTLKFLPADLGTGTFVSFAHTFRAF